MAWGTSFSVMCLAGGVLFAGSAVSNALASWNPQSAAAYLDQRAAWWIAWPGAARDHGTFCISCHTALPYALSRPALRAALHEYAPSSNERKLLANVTQRVRLWNEAKPFYGEQIGPNKSLQSRGTESVLNALILANFDARNGKMSTDARSAFQNMWSLQQATGDERGAWPWLDFGNEPFEAKDSLFYGASLAAVAVGAAPEGYRDNPDIQSNLRRLRDYLDREYLSQSLINQAVLLWASARLPGLLTQKQRASIVDDILRTQQSDGGWRLSSLSWTWRGTSVKSLVKLWVRSEDTPFEGRSDGYATGFLAFALEQDGLPREDPGLQRALTWLVRNQSESDGRWPGYSLNHGSDTSPTGLFMSDAATAYAVLALTAFDRR